MQQPWQDEDAAAEHGGPRHGRRHQNAQRPVGNVHDLGHDQDETGDDRDVVHGNDQRLCIRELLFHVAGLEGKVATDEQETAGIRQLDSKKGFGIMRADLER